MIEPKLNYDDITIVPEVVTDIDSRCKCNPYDENGMMPIIASCMSSVVSMSNIGYFNESKIYTVIPRSFPLKDRVKFLANKLNVFNFVAFSMSEAENLFVHESVGAPEYWGMDGWNRFKESTHYICIDLANGHMKRLLNIVKDIKAKWGSHIVIMTGNIANPETYRYYEEAGVDYVRVGIGGGSVCTTTSNTSVGMPYFSLIMETYDIKQEINGKCKIIADGNIQGYGDIQKALLYADYVMIGGLFNKAMESAGKTTYGKSYWNLRGYKIFRPLKTLFTYGKEIPRNEYDKAFKLFKEGKLVIWKWHWGMSTRKAQNDINTVNGVSKKPKTAEGKSVFQKVEYNLSGWAENETDYLRSAMSYTNSHDINEFKDSQWVQITHRRYNE